MHKTRYMGAPSLCHDHVGCHSDFGLKKGQSEPEKDEVLLRFTRLRGFGAEKLMPPGGADLVKTESSYPAAHLHRLYRRQEGSRYTYPREARLKVLSVGQENRSKECHGEAIT